jgi:hypothetical protein
LQLAIDAGADFPWMIYLAATGQSVESPAPYRIGCRLRWWLGDLDNLYARLRHSRWTPRARDKLRAIADFLFVPGPTRNEFFRWNDPAPAAREIRNYVAALFRRPH